MAQTKAIDKSVAEFVNHPLLAGATVSVSIAALPEKAEVVNYDSDRQMLPASAQKAIITATALEVLGSAYTFDHFLNGEGQLVDGVWKGDLLLDTEGDPTFGADRFKETRKVMSAMVNALEEAGIRKVEGKLVIKDDLFAGNEVAASTAWSDIGNYFGCGAPSFSYHENKYDLYLNSTNPEAVSVAKTEPQLPDVTFQCDVKGTNTRSDNAWIYNTPLSNTVRIQGEIPKGKEEFKIKGAVPDAAALFYSEFAAALALEGIVLSGFERSSALDLDETLFTQEIWSGHSPTIKEIVIETNKHSINTYADALLKHCGIKLRGEGSFEVGRNALANFWKERGVEVKNWKLADGSGLSRANHVSTRQMSLIIAKLKPSNKAIFVRSLKPFGADEVEKKATQAKSGTLSGVRGYTGYMKASNGKEYTFAVLVNNHSAKAREITDLIEILLKELRTELGRE